MLDVLDPSAHDARGHVCRRDGWTPERQRRFLAAIAAGATTAEACRHVGLSVTSANAFRRRAAGAVFAHAWRAAALLAREALSDRLFARAMEGYVETVTFKDGTSAERHRIDNRFALTMLARLDRQAEAATDADARAARCIAQEFEPFLSLVGSDDGAARAAAFLAVRETSLRNGDDLSEAADALSRADHFERTGAPYAPPPPPAYSPQLPQLHDDEDADQEEEAEDEDEDEDEEEDEEDEDEDEDEEDDPLGRMSPEMQARMGISPDWGYPTAWA